MSDPNLTTAQPTPNGAKRTRAPQLAKSEHETPQPSPLAAEKPEPPTSSSPDPSKPIDLKMVRAATLVLDQQDAAKALVVGRYMANGGGVDGVVTRLQRYPDGLVVATVSKRARIGETVTSADRYLLIQGDLECEVLT
jgi:hypothetical protein